MLPSPELPMACCFLPAACRLLCSRPLAPQALLTCPLIVSCLSHALPSLAPFPFRPCQLTSILMRGTRLQTGGIDAEVDEYCHWTFPDDDQASGCPSYMMARRLKPVEERVPIRPLSQPPVTTIERTRHLLVRERPPITPSDSRREIYDRLMAEKAAGGASAAVAATPLAAPPKLFNRVIRIRGETSYKYW